MSESPSQANGEVRWRPVLPTTLVVVSIIVAVGAVTGLIALLYRETRGPGEILREFAQAVDEGNCEGSYHLLDQSVQARITEESWCQRLPQLDEQIDADFDLDQAVLQGDRAVVHISGAPTTTWRLARFGERSWRVLGPAEGGSFAEG